MNDKLLIDLKSRRAYEARLSQKLSPSGYRLGLSLAVLLILLAALLALLHYVRVAILLTSPAALILVLLTWWKYHLASLPASGTDISSRLSRDVLGRLKPAEPQTPANLWKSLRGHWQAAFILHHLLLPADIIAEQLNNATPAEVVTSLEIATHFADQNKQNEVELGYVVAGIILASDATKHLLSKLKLQPNDVEAVANWLGRSLNDLKQRANRDFGGIGRDWAFGFTPLLNRYGLNVSLGITDSGLHFGWLTQSDGVTALENALNNNAMATALIGPVGVGKSSTVYALAQKLIEGRSKQLAYHQIISINATEIISRAGGPGQLERIMVALANEAAHAGHIILFFDDAELFLNNRPGSFDAGQILLSIAQARAVPFIMALTPTDFERLKANNPGLASLLTPVVLTEPDEASVLRILEDTALGLEHRHRVLISYEAIKQAYTLAGRYEHDEAYPGKAIKLLSQAITSAEQSVVSARSVEHCVEQSRGVKVGQADQIEADQLLKLEEQIHQRMINQSQAVNAVASALRRARAGVTNPKRPIGSFLFLGPTGVGKTELARSLAATYFNNEANMIRLDMSEYAHEDSLNRLLSGGQNEANSLTLAIRQQPFCVLLLDEIEKAHPKVLNLLLQLLDEGNLTDLNGRSVSFKDAIIIATSNAGAQSIHSHLAQGESLESFQPTLIEELITSGQFKPELINRFDEVVLFRPLSQAELKQVVTIMLAEINKSLANQNLAVSLTDAGINKIVETGYDPKLGARPMRRVLSKAVEDSVAKKILKSETKSGDHLVLDEADLNL